MTFPKIGITIGDPGGIGPEIILQTFSRCNSLTKKAHYILYGNYIALQKYDIPKNLEIVKIQNPEQSSDFNLSFFEVETALKIITPGHPSKEAGKASFCYFDQAVKHAQKKLIQSIVTAPISKHSWNLAGIPWSGHTDFLWHLFPKAIMSFWSDKLKVILYTHHLPLKEAITKIQKDSLLSFFHNLSLTLEKTPLKSSHLLVAGLNPHAGEMGTLGSEEEEEIIPAIKQAQKEGLSISGPYPPDVVFREAFNKRGKIVIALYHDQGCIPFKLESFHTGVNVTLGLPFPRTSPDHGTAFDISGKRMADFRSMEESIKLAYKLSVIF